MQALYKSGFPTPRPVDSNRHAILMSLIDGKSMYLFLMQLQGGVSE